MENISDKAEATATAVDGVLGTIYHKIIAVLVVLLGGLFSLGLWSKGYSWGSMGEGSYLGVIMLFVCVGLGSVIWLLAKLVDQSTSKHSQ